MIKKVVCEYCDTIAGEPKFILGSESFYCNHCKYWATGYDAVSGSYTYQMFYFICATSGKPIYIEKIIHKIHIYELSHEYDFQESWQWGSEVMQEKKLGQLDSNTNFHPCKLQKLITLLNFS